MGQLVNEWQLSLLICISVFRASHTLRAGHIDGETETVEKAHSILLGGNQLTTDRARYSIKAKMNSQTPEKQLTSIIPVMEDWHTKANFLGTSTI